MAQLPSSIVLQELRHLKGGARVTFPGADTDVKKVERVVKMPRNAWSIAYYTADSEFATELLTAQVKLGEDAQFAEVYREYQTLPGVLLSGIETDQETNEQISVTRRLMRNDAALPSNGSGIVYEKQPIDDVVAIHVSRDMSNLLGKTFISYPNISYSFPGLLVMKGGSLTENRQPASYRSAFSKVVRARVEVTFTVEAEDHSEELFEAVPVNIRSDFGSFSSVLHNLRDVVVGGRREKVEQSSPSSVEYPIGDEVLIRAPSERSVNGLYRNELTYITLL